MYKTLWTQHIKSLQEKEHEKTGGSNTHGLYLNYHKKRFSNILKTCNLLQPNKKYVVLDIGRSNLTAMLAAYYTNTFSLGFSTDSDTGGHREVAGLQNVKHINFDLNQSENPNVWPDFREHFDLIVYSETIEHLHTAPEYSLMLLNFLLKPNGILLITTPNAASIQNRLRLLLGKNPFERIRLNTNNPGHFREYTKAELQLLGKTANFESVIVQNRNFFSSRFLFMFKLIPQFSDSLVVVMKKFV